MQNLEDRFFRPVAQKIRNRAARAAPVKLARLHLAAPIASFTFDDFAKSAWQAGGRLVEAYGGRATYYMAGKLSGQPENGVPCFDEDDLVELAERGHDIGCHTFEHIAIPDHTSPDIERSLSANLSYLKRATGKTAMTSFAYPFGAASIRTKLLLKDKFLACRGIYSGINAGLTDLSQLNALCLHRADMAIESYVQKAVDRAGWLIFVGHDVCERPSAYGCTPKVLEDALRLVSAAGIEILTMDASLRRILEFDGVHLKDQPSPTRPQNSEQ
jgi:peptidoglycan/xylan/chitin deacetylase (PgdA/CDA1 family)